MTNEQQYAISQLRAALHEYIRVWGRSNLALALLDWLGILPTFYKEKE